MAKATKSDDGIKYITRNRRAFHDYEILDRLEAGIVLVGTEVKSLRAGFCILDGSYVRVDDGEIWLVGCEIPEYSMGNRLNHEPKRRRKLLIHRNEVEKFAEKAEQKGFTLMPLAVYFKEGKAKVEIAIAQGKQMHDKRESKKKADALREMKRATAHRGR